MKRSTIRERLLASTFICGAAALTLTAAPAWAQTDPDQSETEAQQAQNPITPGAGSQTDPAEQSVTRLPSEEASPEDEVAGVVVTGTRIQRPNLEAPTAVSVIDARAIEATGEINAGDIVRTLPQTGVSSLTPTNSNFFTQNNGVTTVELRNLGEDRTLVLLNGRRFTPGVPGSQIVDFNTIPTEFLDRIDVVTGGASAIYGSDALAGVINIITRKNYEGFEIFGQAGVTEYGDYENFRVGLRLGSNFADGRGNVAGTVSYISTGAVFARDRCDRDMCLDGLGGAFFGADFRTTFTPFYSGFIPRGVALVPRIGAGNLQRVVDDTGATVPYVGAVFGFNRQAFRALFVPQTAIKFASQINYELSPHINFFNETSVYTGETKNDIEPTPLGSSDIFINNQNVGQNPTCTAAGCQFGIPITSAVVPESLRNAVRLATPTLTDAQRVVGFQRRLMEFGNRRNEANRTLFRNVLGIEGDINPGLAYELSFNYGRTSVQQLSQGGILRGRILDTLNAEVGPDGQVRCVSEVARAQGCQPFFVFQEGGASQGVRNYIGLQNQFDSFIEEMVLNGFLSGDLINIPGGPVQFVAGFESRREESRNTPDPTLQQGLATGNIAPETRGQFEVHEAFGELRIPLLRDMPFAEALDVNLAMRVSDYSTVGYTDAWSASIEYTPIQPLKFRTQYAKAVRAPNISELFSGRSQTFPQVVDPCAGATRTAAGEPAFFKKRNDPQNPQNVLNSGVDPATVGSKQATVCLQDPAINARVQRDGGFALTQPELQGVGGFNSGNPNLDVETGTTFTFGVLFNPRWNEWWSPLSISVDYFDIQIEDAIQGIGRQTALNQCYGATASAPATYQPQSPFCVGIIRNEAGTANVGSIRESNLQQQNIAELTTRGIDVQASYNLDLNRVPFAPANWDMGSLTASLTYQKLLEFKTTPFPGGTPTNSVGFTGASENEGVLDLLYARGPLQWTWQFSYVGESCFFVNEQNCDKDDYINDAYIGQRVFADTQIRYRVSDLATFYFGVDNVFDEYVRIGQSQGTPTGWTTQPDVYDGLGRRYYTGFRLRF